jgi:putative DNA methylase
MVALMDSYAPGPDGLAEKLLKFTAEMSSFEHSNNPTLLSFARQLIELSRTDATLVDTFSGGGSIPLESLRLGVNTYASDLNPIAASGLSLALEAAPGMTDAAMSRLATDVAAIGDDISKRLQAIYLESNVLAYFWCRTYFCAGCGREAPLLQNMWLSKKRRPTAIIVEEARDSGEIVFGIVSPESSAGYADAERGTMDGRGARCVFCGDATALSDIQQQGMDGRLGDLLYAKCIKTKVGKQYIPVSWADSMHALKARIDSNTDLDLGLDLDMNGVRHLWAIQYGVRTVSDLFNPRQQFAIHALH